MKKKVLIDSVIKKGSLALFTGREDSISEFSEKLDSLLVGVKGKGNIAGVINNYGIGGIGKSILNSKYIQIIEEKNKTLSRRRKIMTMCLDFSPSTLPSTLINKVLVRMQNQYGKKDFFCTKYAKIVLHEKYGVEYEFMNELNKEVLPSNKVFNASLSVVEFLSPYGGMIGFVHKIFSIVLGKKHITDDAFYKTCMKKLKKDPEGQELLEQITQNSKEDFEKMMPDYFLHDLKKIMERSKAPLVIIVDTYEMLSKTRKANVENVERFLDDLIRSVPNTLWIISGRKKVLDDTNKKVMSSTHIREHHVDLFTEDQIKEYLTKAGIENTLWPRFISISNGVPYALSLLYDAYIEKKKRKDDSHLDQESYGDSLDRFLDRYFEDKDEKTKKVLLYLSAIGNDWTSRMIQEIAPSLGDFSLESYNSIIESSSVSCSLEGRYSIVDGLDDVIRTFVTDEIKEKINECLSNYYISLMEREDIVIDTEMVLEFAKYSSDKEKENVFLDKVLPLLQNLESMWRYQEMVMILNSFESSLTNCSDLETKRRYLEKQYRVSYNIGFVEKAISTADSLLMIADNYDYKYKSWVYSIKGDAERSAGRYKDELNSRVNALEILMQFLPENHQDTLSSLYNLAVCLQNLGRYKEALEKYERCYELMKQVPPENHQDTLSFLSNLANCLMDLGKYKEALEKFERCYEIRKQVLTENHQDTLSSLNNLAVCLQNLGRNEEALEKHKRCYEIRKQVLTENHPDTLRSLCNIANCLMDLGKNKEALEKYERCYELMKQVLTENHPNTLLSLNNLANCLRDLGRYEEALEKHKRCYEIRKQVLSENHPDTLISLGNIAICLMDLGRYKEALEKHERCYELMKQVLTENHPDTLTSLNNLAICLEEAGQYEKAFDCYWEYYSKGKSVFKKNNSRLRSALIHCKDILIKIGKPEEVEKIENEMASLALGEATVKISKAESYNELFDWIQS